MCGERVRVVASSPHLKWGGKVCLPIFSICCLKKYSTLIKVYYPTSVNATHTQWEWAIPVIPTFYKIHIIESLIGCCAAFFRLKPIIASALLICDGE